MKKCSRRNSVALRSIFWPLPVIRARPVEPQPAISTTSSLSKGARRRITALIRASNSRGEKGLVM